MLGLSTVYLSSALQSQDYFCIGTSIGTSNQCISSSSPCSGGSFWIGSPCCLAPQACCCVCCGMSRCLGLEVLGFHFCFMMLLGQSREMQVLIIINWLSNCSFICLQIISFPLIFIVWKIFISWKDWEVVLSKMVFLGFFLEECDSWASVTYQHPLPVWGPRSGSGL